MKLKTALRGLLLDWLADRDDRCYWRQAFTGLQIQPSATVCLWQPDGKLGDAVILSALVAAIAEQRPDVQLKLVCSSGLVSYWREIKGLKAVVDHADGAHKSTSATLGPVDVFISLETFLSIDTVKVLRALRPGTAIGFSVAQYRLFDIALSDLTYAFPRRHIGSRLDNLCELLALDAPTPGPHLAAAARHHLTPRVACPPSSDRVFLNTMGAASHRCLNPDSVEAILRACDQLRPGIEVIVSVATPERDAWERRIRSTHGPQVKLAPANLGLWELIGLVAQCPIVITPDTAIGHIGAAVGSAVCVFYADAHYNPIVWHPRTDRLVNVMPRVAGDVNNFETTELPQRLQALFSLL